MEIVCDNQQFAHGREYTLPLERQVPVQVRPGIQVHVEVVESPPEQDP